MNYTVASYWEESKESKDSKDIACKLCPNNCLIKNGSISKCGARRNADGILYAENYGYITTLALDPIEKKPLYHFHSGKYIVSIGSFGCNFNCLFCQNHSISMKRDNLGVEQITPETIAEIAIKSVAKNNIGVAYTYNEPLIGYEFVKDCSILVKRAGLMNVLVTNGYINEEPLIEIIQLIDAVNIDIKAHTERTYKMVGGTLKDIKRIVEIAIKHCHVEVTTMLIPEITDGDIENIAKWLSEIDKDIPYHLSRFYPRYKYNNYEATPIKTMHKFKSIAERYLSRVYLGNV